MDEISREGHLLKTIESWISQLGMKTSWGKILTTNADKLIVQISYGSLIVHEKDSIIHIQTNISTEDIKSTKPTLSFRKELGSLGRTRCIFVPNGKTLADVNTIAVIQRMEISDNEYSKNRFYDGLHEVIEASMFVLSLLNINPPESKQTSEPDGMFQ